MSLEITTSTGKRIGLTDCENALDEFVMIDNKRVLLSDVYKDNTLRIKLNDEIKQSK
jgi:hypothetical protein